LGIRSNSITIYIGVIFDLLPNGKHGLEKRATGSGGNGEECREN